MVTDPNVLKTTAGEIALEEYHLRLEAHEWKILHAGAILSDDDEQRFLGADEPRVPYGLVLWPAAIALAHEVASRPMEGLSVLELGAGTGLPGIVAATLGARVVQTDRHALALGLAKRNADRNAVPTTIGYLTADWSAWDHRRTYDFIFGADILYARTMHPALRRIFDENLAPGGTILLSDPFRKSSFMLLEAMEEDGWNVSVSKWTVGVEPPERSIAVFEVTRG